MDEGIVRKHLEEIRHRLNQLDEERDVLLNLLKGYEGWLRLKGATNGHQPQLMPARSADRFKPKGTISLRRAILKVIREAGGEPLHSSAILTRVHSLGAVTEAKDPQAVVDLTAYSLQKGGEPIEKCDPRTWRWIGARDGLPESGGSR